MKFKENSNKVQIEFTPTFDILLMKQNGPDLKLVSSICWKTKLSTGEWYANFPNRKSDMAKRIVNCQKSRSPVVCQPGDCVAVV